MTVSLPMSIFVYGIGLCLLVGPVFVVANLFRRSIRNKKSPLNIQLLRAPGQSLLEEISELTMDIVGDLLMVPIAALVLYASYTTYQIYEPKSVNWVMTYGFPLTVVAITIWVSIVTFQRFKRRNSLRLGYDCELAVGQDLTELVRLGKKRDALNFLT